jgi:hypothetical protein
LRKEKVREKDGEREENECTKMLKSVQVRIDGCWDGFVCPKGLPKSSRAVLIVAGTTHTHTTLGDGLDGCGMRKAPQ